jgi:hypothetical protein
MTNQFSRDRSEMSAIVTRRVIDARVRSAFSGNEPLAIADVADLLEIERDHCYQAFEKFQALVTEKIEAIAACDAELKRARDVA